MFFWHSLAFPVIQQMLAIWPLVPLSFLNPAWTSGSSQFTYCWSLIWRILSIALLVCEGAVVGSSPYLFTLSSLFHWKLISCDFVVPLSPFSHFCWIPQLLLLSTSRRTVTCLMSSWPSHSPLLRQVLVLFQAGSGISGGSLWFAVYIWKGAVKPGILYFTVRHRDSFLVFSSIRSEHSDSGTLALMFHFSWGFV